jgi:hypothetical protein
MFPQTTLRRHLLKPWHTSRRWYSTIVEPEFQSSIDLPASNHHDLPSFLDYASRVGADPQSSVYVGTVYEYTVQSALARLGMSLKRVGGKSDFGIDLFGTWNIPSAASSLKVLVQCKARGTKSKPSEIRELEGAFVGAPSGWRSTGVLGFLVSQQEATKGVREAMGRSRWPMGYVMCSGKGRILQMLWNRKADDEGLLGVGVTVKYVGGDREDKEIILIWPKNIPGRDGST